MARLRPRSPRTRWSALALSIALGTTSVAHAQQPATSEDAGAHFERGLAFFKDGDYEAAMVAFKKAYELDPNYRALYNLGQTSRELKDYAAALVSFERYLAEGGAEIDAERRKKVEGWVAELKDKIGRVTFKANVADAEVAVDDIFVGKTPLTKPVVVNAGRRKLVVTKAGYAPLTRFIDVAGTEEKTVDLELTSLTGGGSGGDKAAPAEIEHTAWPWVGLGTTAALGIAWGTVGGLAIGKKSAFDDAIATFPTNGETIDAARSDAKTFALAADVLGGVTGAAAALTILAFALDYGRSSPSQEAPAAAIVGPGYVGVSGRF